jgi:cytochrome c-type biogenesis protein CcmH/NrfG
VSEAHNLYVETLLELGPLGLFLVTLLVLVPLVAALRVRYSPLVPAACGAVVAYATHAAGEWDWEIPGVTLVALGCGFAIAAEARTHERMPIGSTRRAVVVAAALVVALAFSLVGLIGNSALAAGVHAARNRTWEAAHRHARTATELLPWSSDAWLVLGRAQLGLGDVAHARHSFSVAVARDSRNWQAWVALAQLTRGAQRADALARLELLNPRAPAVRRLEHAAARGSPAPPS